MGFLDQIKKGLTVTSNPTQARTARTSKEKNPVVSDLRLYSNGAIYPSASLTKNFQLEFTNRDANKIGNGFDVVDSRKFPNTAGSTPAFLMITPVSKSLPKVDLFDSCRYGENNEPLVSVMDQGSKTFGLQLVSMLKEVYGTTIEEGGYVDLDILKDFGLSATLKTSTNGIYLIPKTISRGEKKDTQTYIRRENLVMYVLVPHSLNTNSADVAVGGNSDLVSETETNKVNA